MVSSNEMKIIDFSNGIRSAEIQHNFNVLTNQLARERLAIAGHGVSSGLEMLINDFTVTITKGALVDVNGKEIFFDETKIKISLPKQTRTTETKEVSATGKVVLTHVPYAATGKTTSQYVPVQNCGVQIVRYDNSTATVAPVSFDGNSVYVDARFAGQKVVVNYGYTNKRYDTIYIDDNYNVAVAEGMTSSSPSVQIPAKYKYILGFILVDPFALNEYVQIQAQLMLKTDLKQLRNIYTDKDNELFICGVPFKDLQIIHMVEPKNPVENTLWYDGFSNKLRVWKTFKGISEWICVNDTSFIPVLEYKIWSPDVNPEDRQTFMFADDEINLKFTPGKNELQVLIGQIPLNSDQFDEIVLEDTTGEYENVGVGFRLAQPLDRPDFVEVRVTHRVNDNPLKRRFQRSATFIAAGTHTYSAADDVKTFSTPPYRKGENQLEVYVDGRRLVSGIDFIEGTDLSPDAAIGTLSKSFDIAASLVDGALVAYKITTSVYSYDNVNQLIDDVDTKLDNALVRVETAAETVAQLAQDAAQQIDSMDTRVRDLEDQSLEHADFIKKTDKIGMANVAPDLSAGIAKGLINMTITKMGSNMPIPGVNPEDFIIMFDMQRVGGNSIVRREVDYTIGVEPDGVSTFIQFINPTAIPDGNTLYITGVKYK